MGKKKKKTNPVPYKVVQFGDIPRELQLLAINISKLEKAIMTTKDGIAQDFDHIIDKLVDVKKAIMTIIQQAKMLEKAKVEEKKAE